MKTLQVEKKVETASNSPIVNNILGLCKKYKLSVKSVETAPDAQSGAVTLISVVINKALMVEGDAYFLPLPLTVALNKLSFSTKKFNYSTGFNPKAPRLLVILVNEFVS